MLHFVSRLYRAIGYTEDYEDLMKSGTISLVICGGVAANASLRRYSFQ